VTLKASFYFFLTICCILFPPTATPSDKSFFEDTLVLTTSTDPKTFNILIAQETSSTRIAGYFFEGLTEYNPITGKMIPKLAESWERSEDGLHWTFYLRKNVLWSDGKPFTARDVLFTYKEIIFNPEIPTSARDILTIDGKLPEVVFVDDHTLRFHLPSPFAPFLFTLSNSIMPKHILKDAVDDGSFMSTWGLSEKPERIVGTGPFKLKEIVAGERIELIRNKNYWKKDLEGNRLPYLERIFFLVIPSPESTLLRFLEGETDLYGVRGVDYPLLKPLEQKKGFKIYETGPDFGSRFVGFNWQAKNEIKKKWFRNRDFRIALAHAIDRQSMKDIIFNRLAVEQCSAVSPSNPIYFTDEVTCYDYNPKRAMEMLEELGFLDRDGDGTRESPEGENFEMVMMTNAEASERLQMAQMIREDWSQVGMKVHLLPLEFNTLVAKLTVTQDWEVVIIGLTGSIEPHFGANVWRSNGSLHFWNPKPEEANDWEKKIDEIFRLGSMALDEEERKQYYFEWQKIVASELPVIYTLLSQSVFAVRDRFESLNPTPLGGAFYPIEELRIRKS